ncbi:MAG: 2-C-methyl-D-erythritol 2,4-cyclodiphosphate synthase [Dethiosulfovibrio peptidovorans]|nr:MAG: 2-C-methyl-D-erythritol 2,4-cyclodiphosphate synthase [Dethiosulfovibrio peptidovorans]
MKNSWAFLIMAAGSGQRLGGQPKQFRLLGKRPVWQWAAGAARASGIDDVILTVPPERLPPDIPSDRVTVIRGGETRSLSVRNALRGTDASWVLVHDAARPFVSPDLCRSVMSAVTECRGVIPLLPVVDAAKRIREGESVMSSVDRDGLMMTQTPQGFHRESLLDVLESSSPLVRDEAEPWLASGRELTWVLGETENFKITTEGEWSMAQKLATTGATVRTGVGFDVHPLVPDRPLILGGVSIPSPLGLDGHSDADVICHALSDAALGAAGLPDIGRLYPASDETYRGADSYELLRDVINRLRNCGWGVIWADIVLHAQIPRIGDGVEDIVNKLECLWNDGRRRINLKVKSGEGIGPVGQGEAMTCYAVVTVTPC